jgi:hypothetical protein
MKDDFTDAEGWIYTTPICAGSDMQIARSCFCRHEWQDRQPMHNEHGLTMVLQGCIRCVAVRTKRKPI